MWEYGVFQLMNNSQVQGCGRWRRTCSEIRSGSNNNEAYNSQQTRHIYPVFSQCWANVLDGGPTLDKNWVDVSFLGGMTPVPE